MRSSSALALIVVAFPFLTSAARPASQPAAGGGEKRLTVAHLIALRNGGEVRLAPGIYVSATQINIRAASGFALVGEGVTIRAQVRLDDCKDFRISGITFDGARTARGPSPNLPTLRLAHCSGFTLENCVFRDARGEHLFLESECRQGLVTNCRFLDAWRNAIAIVNGHDLRFTSNTIDTVHGEVLGAGIDIESNLEDPEGANHDITVSRSTFRNCAESGVRITNGREPYRIDVLDNTFENCPSGVLIAGRDCRIRGNVFRDAKRPGGKIGEEVRAQVSLSGTGVGGITEVSGNRFQRLSDIGGVFVHPTWRGPALVTNNVFSDVTGKGINAVTIYSADAVVTGNVVLRVENGVGIGISGRGATVMNNVLQVGSGAGAIWSDVDGGWYADNRVSGWPTPLNIAQGNTVN